MTMTITLAVLGPRTFSKSGSVTKLDRSWTEIPGEEGGEKQPKHKPKKAV